MATDLIPSFEAAEMLGISVPTLHRWVESGKLVEHVKAPGLRGARLFKRSDVERLAAKRMATAAAKARVV